MSPRVSAVVAVLLLAAAPAFAQDWYEPNPSLARLSADDAYARTSAASLKAARIDGATSAIRLDDAGRVLVAGGFFNDRPRIVRLDAAGRLDPTFGNAGIAELPVEGGTVGLEIDAAGRIVVTGSFGHADEFPYPWSPGYAGPWYGAARLLADGSLDPDFSGDGLLKLDTASGLHGLGAVHASGSDGAMLALTLKPGPLLSSPIYGLVRIAADGTIDATYGGGFAQVAPLPDSGDYYDSVEDFAVDSAGRAVVAVRDQYGPRIVLHLDVAGGLDPSWKVYPYEYGYYAYAGWTASQLAFDGAGRLVGIEDTRLSRRLPDGKGDPTFSGDGFALNQFSRIQVGLTLDQEAQYCYAVYMDSEHVGPGCDGEFLAVATHADRWALAKLVYYRDARRRVVARGIEVRAIDPADPGAIVSTTYRSPDPSFSQVMGLAIAPDGTAAYALGGTFVLRVDLANRKALPLPDLRVRWLGWPHAVDFGGGRYRVTARVRIRNVARHDAESVIGLVGVGDAASDVALAPFPNAPNSNPFRVRARSSVVKRFTWEGGDIKTNLAGVRLGIQVSCELPDAVFADNTATSLPITPLYAPR